MKIAVCFSGQLRTANHAASNLLRFFGNLFNDIDFYVHTWDINQYKPYYNIRHQEPPEKIEPLEFEIFKEIYNPKRMVIEKYSNMNIPLFYSFSRSVELIEGDYDVVIKLRPDIIFSKRITLQAGLDDFITDTMSFYDDMFAHNIMNDVYWIASQKNMKIAAEYVPKEISFTEHMVKNNVSLKRMSEGGYVRLRPEAGKFNVITEYLKCMKVDRLLYSPVQSHNPLDWNLE
jgi:predicted nucleotidyltransferase